MPRPASEGNKVRLNLEVSAETNKRLDRLQEATDARSRSEVISRSLAICETLVSEEARGSEFVIRRPDGKELLLKIVPAAM